MVLCSFKASLSADRLYAENYAHRIVRKVSNIGALARGNLCRKQEARQCSLGGAYTRAAVEADSELQ
jgi:hypothetical protein